MIAEGAGISKGAAGRSCRCVWEFGLKHAISSPVGNATNQIAAVDQGASGSRAPHDSERWPTFHEGVSDELATMTMRYGSAVAVENSKAMAVAKQAIPTGATTMLLVIIERSFTSAAVFGSGVGDSGTLTVSLSSDVRVSSRREEVHRGGSDWNRTRPCPLMALPPQRNPGVPKPQPTICTPQEEGTDFTLLSCRLLIDATTSLMELDPNDRLRERLGDKGGDSDGGDGGGDIRVEVGDNNRAFLGK
ncbi:hypothetical protein NE237_032387 [Protea cynaroides]|uniref:Uncharacterized protein n=1 Tax=Protea cynaroides TaxID=273540 RepID=A0A9Q0R316_9MAGN|nr:hypothetical protein NE237_032387 [Protea cynaroides]